MTYKNSDKWHFQVIDELAPFAFCILSHLTSIVQMWVELLAF